jgi:hypothetical protein
VTGKSRAELVPILKFLHHSKLSSYPHIGRLVECVTGNIQQVGLRTRSGSMTIVGLSYD